MANDQEKYLTQNIELSQTKRHPLAITQNSLNLQRGWDYCNTVHITVGTPPPLAPLKSSTPAVIGGAILKI